MSNFVLPAIIMMIIGLFVFISTAILCQQVNRVFQKRYNTIIIGVIGLIIFFAGKYVWYILDVVNNAPPIYINISSITIDSNFWSNLKIANLAIVNFPDLILLILSIALIFDKTKAFTKAIGPYAIFFGLFYLINSSLNYSINGYVASYNLPWYRFIFEGDGLIRMPSITFIYISFLGLVSVISNREYSRWSIIGTILVGGLLISYSLIFQAFFNVGANGLNQLSFSGLVKELGVNNGNYFSNYFFKFGQAINLHLGTNENRAWLGSLTIYLTLLGYLIILFLLKNLLTTDIKRINYIYWPWYHKSKTFRNLFASLDASINNMLYRFARNCYLFGIRTKDLGVIDEYVEFLESVPYGNDININRLKTLVSKLEIKQEKLKKKNAKNQKNKKREIDQNFFNFENNPNNSTNLDSLATNKSTVKKEKKKKKSKKDWTELDTQQVSPNDAQVNNLPLN